MRKLATAAFSFAAGIFLAQYLLPLSWQLRLCPVFLVLGCLGFLRHGQTRLRVLILGGALAAALLWNWAYASAVLPGEEPAEQPGAVMTLCGYPAATEYGARATVRIAGVPGKAVYYGDADLLELTPGCTVTDDVLLSSAARIRDDDVTTFTSRGVFRLAFSRGTPEMGRGSAESPRWWPVRVGQAARSQIRTLFSGDTAGFLTAMLTGDKSGLSEQTSSDLSEAGIYHILAVSGIHCGFLLAIILALTGRQRRRLAAALAVPVLLFYMVLTGCSPSVVRACVMLIALLLAPLTRREGDPPTALSAALLLILLANPFAAASVSLQLSFTAMAGLLWIAPGVYRLLTGGRSRNRVWKFIAVSMAASLGAAAFTAPLCAYYFGIFWLVSPLTNLLCLWAAGAIYGSGLLAVALSFAWHPLGVLLALIPRALIAYLLWVCHLLAGLPGHAVYFTNPYLKYWLVYLYLLFALAWLLRRGRRRQYLTAAALAALALGVTVLLGQDRFVGGALNIVALDVGQGECVLLSSQGEYAAADCGSANSWYSPGELAADELSSLGCRSLRYLLLTHYDTDHVNGVADLLARIPVETLLVPDTEDDAGVRDRILALAREKGTEVRLLSGEASRYTLGDADLTVYPPLGTGGDNELGLSLLATAGDFDFLMTGDMDCETEETLLARYRLPDVEALLVGHHGSAGSTSPELLETVRPEAAIISVGANSYGHPKLQTLLRLEEAGAAVYRTDRMGNIRITVN